MKNGKTLIKNGRVISMDKSIGDFAHADILIKGDTIREVSPEIDASDAEVYDASGMIVMPGFIDCHRHMWQTQLRALTADWSLFDYSARIRCVYSSFYSPEDAYLGTYAGILEALNAGVTTVVDHSHIMNSPDHADAVIRAYGDARTRAIFCYGLFKNFAPTEEIKGRNLFAKSEWHYDDVRRIKNRYFSSEDSLVLLGIALTEAEYYPMEVSRKEIGFAREIGAKRISAHVGMGAMSKHTRFVERLERANLLGQDLLFVHGWSLTEKELAVLARHGASLVCTPETELQMGMGFPVISRMLLAGGRAVLGIDIVSNNSADMFTQIRLSMAVLRALENAKLDGQDLMPRTIKLKARDMLELVTIGAAKAVGMDAVTGSITPGKKADLIMVRTDSVNMMPVNDPVNSVVMTANVGDIDTVMVGGEMRKRNGKLVDVDLLALRDKLLRSRNRIMEEAHNKGFDKAEKLVEKIFPVSHKLSWLARLNGWALRLPIPSLHRALFNYLLEL